MQLYMARGDDSGQSSELEGMMMDLLDFEETEELLQMAEMDLYEEQQIQREIDSVQHQGQNGIQQQQLLPQQSASSYFDPLWGFFNSDAVYSSRLEPTIYILEVEDLAPPAVSAADVAKLEKRIEELEYSNALLVAGFNINADAFWGVCTPDVLGLCNTDQLQEMPCVYAQTEAAAQCLGDNWADIQAPECRLGVQRMAAWLTTNANSIDHQGNALRGNDYGPNADSMTFIIHFLIFSMILLCLIRCCAACVGIRRRSALRHQRIAASRAAAAAAPSTAASASPCERGEILQGTALAPKTATRNITVRGVPVDVQVEDGKHYL